MKPKSEITATLALTLTALGVVFGDIGTSPLYAMRECFCGHAGLSTAPANVLGVLSLMIWTILLVVAVKYLWVVLQADHRGEGGILALMTLVTQGLSTGNKRRSALALLGLLGAALLYGDGVITPTITVLSAVEGLNVATHVFEPFIVPIAIMILLVLFTFQHRGTASVGATFGPVMVVWFALLGLVGLYSCVQCPGVFAALNPAYAARFLLANGRLSFGILGTLFLAVTGAEMLYADLGHFGRRPIRLAWYGLAMPCLLLNYAGQASVLLRHPESAENLFFRVAPALLYPMVVMATLASIIASQAVISGAFSMARQAVQLGLWPRMAIVHTSAIQIGQVYVPFINLALLIGTTALALIFRESGRLAAAYGIAVSGTMLITTIFILVWLSGLPGRLRRVELGIMVLMLGVDIVFFSANMLKIASGGWIVLLIAAGVYLVMSTWRRGRQILRRSLVDQALDLDMFRDEIESHKPVRVPGVAVFLTGSPRTVPRALLHNFKHNKVLHDPTVLLTIRLGDVPRISEHERITYRNLNAGLHYVEIRFGYFEEPDVSGLLGSGRIPELAFNPMTTTYFLGKETLLISRRAGLSPWRKNLFRYLSQNALDATRFFHLPPNRVVELGLQVEL